MSLCQNNPRHPCCGQYMTDRFFPIGPNIQPTLTENWVSALFEFGGRDPVGFSTVVTIFLTLVIGALVSAWGLLGFYLGKFKIYKKDMYLSYSPDPTTNSETAKPELLWFFIHLVD